MKSAVSGCSVEEAMRLLGGRWRLLIASYLLDGPKRFNELRREMPAISQRMLTLDLRALQDADLVKRTAFPTVPVTVEYELTADGERLRPVVEVMRQFGFWVKAKAGDQASLDEGMASTTPVPRKPGKRTPAKPSPPGTTGQ